MGGKIGAKGTTALEYSMSKGVFRVVAQVGNFYIVYFCLILWHKKERVNNNLLLSSDSLKQIPCQKSKLA